MTKLKLGRLSTINRSSSALNCLHLFIAISSRIGVQLARTAGATKPIEPAKLIAPMLERFMATDRVFAKARRLASSTSRVILRLQTFFAQARRSSNAWLRLCGDQRSAEGDWLRLVENGPEYNDPEKTLLPPLHWSTRCHNLVRPSTSASHAQHHSAECEIGSGAPQGVTRYGHAPAALRRQRA